MVVSGRVVVSGGGVHVDNLFTSVSTMEKKKKKKKKKRKKKKYLGTTCMEFRPLSMSSWWLVQC